MVTCQSRPLRNTMMASAHVARPSALLCLLCAVLVEPLAAARTCAAKWAQYLDGTVVAVVQLQREGQLCKGETASVDDNQTLHFSMQCAGEEYALDVVLQHAVDEGKARLTREPGAVAVVSLQKAAAHVWWTSLALHPDKYKALLTRDFGRGDPEPDPDELEEMAAEASTVEWKVDGSGRATKAPKKQKAPPTKKETRAAEAAMRQQDSAMAEWDILAEHAQRELKPTARVTPQTVAKLKALRAELPEEDARISAMLGYLYLKRGDTTDGQTMLRRSIKMCKNGIGCRGAHQALAESITKHGGATEAAVVAEAIELYQKGSMLLPDHYETYYQLGRMLSIQSSGPIGGKSDAAAAALRTAASLQPKEAEALQMLAVHLAGATGKKTRATARKIASRALKLEPASPMSYVTLGKTIVVLEGSPSKLRESVRQEAVEALTIALELSTLSESYHESGPGAPGSGLGADWSGSRGASRDGGAAGGGGEEKPRIPLPLATGRRAETAYMLGSLLSVSDANGAMARFREAVALAPAEARYEEAMTKLQLSIESYRREQLDASMKADAARLKEMEQEEDAAVEEEQASEQASAGGYSDQRGY